MILALLPGFGCSPSHEGNSSARAQTSARTWVGVVEAKRQDLVNETSLTAEFRPDQEVDVMAKASGYLRKIQVDVGDRVRQGDLLATLELPEMEDELTKNRAAITRSQAEVERARLEVKRAETAREITEISYSRLAAVMDKRPGLVAQQEIDTVKNRDLLAEAQISAAQAALQSSEQAVRILEAEAARLQTLQNYTRVLAPFDGVVTKRYADTGAMIQAGTSSQARPVVRIAQIHVVRLVLPVPEAVVPRLRLGSMVGVRVESLNQEFSGRVMRRSNQIQTATRTMETEVDVPNPSGVLVPGMFAKATIRLDQRMNVLTVPVEAIDQEKNESTVLRVDERGMLERRGIELGMETAERVEVMGGLREGDLVVMGNRSQFRPGQKVEIKRLDAPAPAKIAGSQN